MAPGSTHRCERRDKSRRIVVVRKIEELSLPWQNARRWWRQIGDELANALSVFGWNAQRERGPALRSVTLTLAAFSLGSGQVHIL